jgi:hypothetical protein
VLLYVVPGYIDNADIATLLQVAFGAAAVLAALASNGALAARLAAATTASSGRLTGPATDRIRRARSAVPTTHEGASQQVIA